MCVGAKTAALAAWSSGTLDPGAPCVTIRGTWPMRTLCAVSWAVARLWGPLRGPPSGQARGLCGWTRWGAVAVSCPCGTVLQSHGDLETVDTRRMRECTAPVSGWGAVGQARWEGLLRAGEGVAGMVPQSIPPEPGLWPYLCLLPLWLSHDMLGSG